MATLRLSEGGSRLHSPILGLLDDQLSDENFRCQCQWNSPPKKGFDHQPIQRLKKGRSAFVKFPLVFVVSLHLWYLILLVRGFASLAAGPAQDPRNRILWALPKGTVLRGLGWGGGRGSGGSKKKNNKGRKGSSPFAFELFRTRCT